MPTAAHAWRCRSAYSSPAGVEPTRTAVRCTPRPLSFRAATRAATSSLMRAARAAPSMTFDDIRGLYRRRQTGGSRCRARRHRVRAGEAAHFISGVLSARCGSNHLVRVAVRGGVLIRAVRRRLRKDAGDRRPLAERGFYPDSPAQRGDRVLDNRQAQAGAAAGASAARGVDLVKALEDAV